MHHVMDSTVWSHTPVMAVQCGHIHIHHVMIVQCGCTVQCGHIHHVMAVQCVTYTMWMWYSVVTYTM